MDFVTKLQNYLKARYSLLLIKSEEEDRLTNDIKKVAEAMNHDLITWSIASGLRKGLSSIDPSSVEPTKAFDICEDIAKSEVPTIFVFFDITPILNSANGLVYQRRLKEFALNIRQNGYRCNCILISDDAEIKGSINSEITILDYPLPNREEVYKQVLTFAQKYQNVPNVYIDMSAETLSAIGNAALGLSYADIENCLARALVEDRCLDMNDVHDIMNEKKQIIKKSGILEYIENKLDTNDVGGLTVLKSWLNLRGKTFSEDAKVYGLNPPKGVLLVGVPGCGKSLTAKCISGLWKIPLLKLDIGKVFGRYVGDSEANIRQALKTAEAISPCILWIDEIEKGLVGDFGDSGVSSRVFGHILTWMQDKTSSVFTIATANDIMKLPPELMRKGRFDEIFFVDLPDYEERKNILSIHISKSLRNPAKFDLDTLATLSGEEYLGKNIRLSGAELESWVKDSLMEAYARRINGDANAELSMEDFKIVLNRIVPMAKMRQEDISKLREWANENAVSASISASSDNKNSVVSLGGRRIDL